MSSVTNAPRHLTSSRCADRSARSATSGRRFWTLLFAVPWDVKGQSALNQYGGSKGAPAAV